MADLLLIQSEYGLEQNATWVNVGDPNAAKVRCEPAGAKGVVQGRWLDHRCDWNGLYTYTLWIYR